ncbi:Protein Abitram [Lamellibrachia satsuma]|nr:Protein Abitram [Lamellibrachia satsuma]
MTDRHFSEMSHASVVDRYFTKRYVTDINNKHGEDQCVLMHSNRICVITLAPSHPILDEGKSVTQVNFKVNAHMDRLNNKVTGKAKKGAQMLDSRSLLCFVTCTDGSTYTLRSCIKGGLIEANEQLVDHPELLTQKPSTNGYIAIILTRLQSHEQEMAKLLTQEQYQDILKQREIKHLNEKTS